MPSITPQTKIQRKNTAKDHDLEKITHPITVTAHKLTPLERRWFGFFVALAKLGYIEINTSIGKLTAEEFRVNGQTHSERTTYRALDGLSKKSIIERNTIRYGKQRNRTTIRFRLEAFSWYLQRRSADVIPLHTCTYTCSHPPTWQDDKLTSNTDVLTPNSCSDLLKEQVSYQKKIASYLLPVLITLRVICAGARSIVIRRATTELATGNWVSGIDWDYWAKRWEDYLHPVRDLTAERELVPALISPSYGRAKKREDKRVDKLIEAFIRPPELAKPPNPLPVPVELKHHPPVPNRLTREELEILEAAKRRCRGLPRAG